jgi:hypothetical protein
MRPLRAAWLATLRATIRLLYHSHPRAFLVSAVASLPEPLFFPAFILLLQQLLQNITTMQVDAPWQRDVRVYRSNLIPREHAALADAYLAQLKQLTRRFLGLRSGAALVQVLGFGLALAAAGALIARGQISLASLAVLVPGMALLSGMLGSL